MKEENFVGGGEDNSFSEDQIISVKDLYYEEINQSKNLGNDIEVQNLYEQKLKYSVPHMSTSFTLNASVNTCNIKAIEKVQFNFSTPSNKIEYIIISKEMPLYGIDVRISKTNEKIIIKKNRLFQDTSYKDMIFVGKKKQTGNF